MGELTSTEKQELYAWIDEVPLSRQKKNISRDFSDGVMAAELAHHFFPHLVDLHNYPPANSTAQKLNNWRTINRKVFFKLDFEVHDSLLQDVVASKPGTIEYLLDHLKQKVEQFKARDNQNLSLPFSYEDTPTGTIHQGITHQHSITSPTHLPAISHLPPIVNPAPPDHTPKRSKVSQIPRPRYSGGANLPLAANQVSHPPGNVKSHKKDHVKLPAIKDGVSKKKYYSGQLPKTGQANEFVSSGLAMAEKDQIIMELQETIQLLTMKVNRLEHLVRVKDMKIQELESYRR